MKTLLILLALASIASAFPAKLRWNKNPEPDVREYRIYQLLDGARILRQTVIPDPATGEKILSQPLEMEPGQQYAVTAYNGFESEPSDPVTIPAVPAKPTGLQVVEIQVSTNLQDWETIALVPLKTTAPTRHIRAGLTTIPGLPLTAD